ncbi:hypothetical protein MseVgp213 [Melanoplus sanguinipes entomopoxvirus]|uniref:Uncharacterized protein n=1 Tax=Melanoplus sanguinipes entomopoxvirus TaxID=83191 RepID=Q9YVM9_MSEPV|nr:hypothetical protein MseVgp213 [Melanoplus sanguinipes entomopoxvirus]AAC97703.1 ORF MSV213 hypothetical protein [Melanoplus sanguinipes entomopoxvirus 'O']
MFIQFYVNVLRDRLKILSIFNPNGTLWCDGTKCEIVFTSNFKCCISIPFIKTNITELRGFDICYDKISELSLKNSIADKITLTFKDNGIYVEELIFENNINIIDPKYISMQSISQINTPSNNNNNFASAERIDDISDINETDNIISEKLELKKHDSGDLTIGYTIHDKFTLNTNNTYKYRINPNMYNKVGAVFKIKLDVLTEFIKKLMTTKGASIEMQVIKNTIKFKAYRTDNIKNNTIDESCLYCSLINLYYPILRKYKIALNNFALLKKLNISISDFKAKDKKIYKYIQFNIIMQEDLVIGLCIYPGSANITNPEELQNYFIFMPVENY